MDPILKTRIQDFLDTWKNIPKPTGLWRYINLNGTPVYLASTWTLFTADGLIWSLDAMSETRELLPYSSKDIRVYENEHPLFESAYVALDYTLNDKVLSFTGSVYVWVLHYIPTMKFHFWMSETSPDGFGRRNIKEWTFRMPAFLPILN